LEPLCDQELKNCRDVEIHRPRFKAFEEAEEETLIKKKDSKNVKITPP